MDMKIEKIQKYLNDLSIEFIPHKIISDIIHVYRCDIFIPKQNLIIECDGDYWHKYPVGRDIDKLRNQELIQKGYKIIRLWEHEINSINLQSFKEKLLNV